MAATLVLPNGVPAAVANLIEQLQRRAERGLAPKIVVEPSSQASYTSEEDT
jgi:hypothetical protein